MVLAMGVTVTGPISAASGAAVPGQTLTVATDNVVTTLDPFLSATDEVQYLANVYQGLVYANPPGAKQPLAPELATRWTHSANGLVWTFYLRHGVHFQDGSIMNAQDVVDSLRLDFPPAGLLWSSVRRVVASGPYTVTFYLKYPMRVDYILTAEYDAWIVGPKALHEPQSWWNQGHSDGTGPYMLTNYKQGQQIVLQAMPDYWGGWHGVHYTTIVNDFVTQAAVQEELMLGGQAQLANGIPETGLKSVKADPQLKVVVAPSFDYYLAYFNTTRPPLNNVLVRQALSYAIPYRAMIQVATAGYGRQMQGPLPYGVYPHDNALPQYHTDLAKARALLAKAGYSHGFSLDMVCLSNHPECMLFAPLWQESFAKIGVHLNVRIVAHDVALSMADSAHPQTAQDIIVIEDWPQYSDDWIDLYWNYACYKPYLFNLSYLCNPSWDNLLKRATNLQVTDPAEAKKLYDQYQLDLWRAAPAAFLYEDRNVYVMDRSVGGFVDTPEYPLVIFYYNLHPQG
jgi:peptide/nickel transport system substrate-binding protein